MPRLKFTDLILHEDDDYLIINKPSFVATLDDRNDPVSILFDGPPARARRAGGAPLG